MNKLRRRIQRRNRRMQRLLQHQDWVIYIHRGMLYGLSNKRLAEVLYLNGIR